MADYEIFREQLAIKYPSYGHALWEPSPRKPDRPVQVGDVGFIRGGNFHRLFNALLPADDPSQELGVPEYHEPLVPNLLDHHHTGSLDRNNYCSDGVNAEPDHGYHARPDDFPRISFQCSRTRGAVLSLPITARREDTLALGDFGRWIVKHIDSWFAFSRKLGLGIKQMEEIILVTGCDRTRSWTNAAFLGNQINAQVSFGVKVEGPGTSINFQFSPENARGAVFRHGPEGENLPENQCVFIRGFRVFRSFWLLPKHLKAAAGPSRDPGGYDSDPDTELVSIPAITKYRDPLHLLLDYIAEQASDCDAVLAHDNDLVMINGIGHGTLPETLEPDVMANLLRRSNIGIHKVLCDLSPTNSPSGSNTNMASVKVAMLPMTFKNWNTAFPSQLPLVAQKNDLVHTSDSQWMPLRPPPAARGSLAVPTIQRDTNNHKIPIISVAVLLVVKQLPSSQEKLGDVNLDQARELTNKFKHVIAENDLRTFEDKIIFAREMKERLDAVSGISKFKHARVYRRACKDAYRYAKVTSERGRDEDQFHHQSGTPSEPGHIYSHVIRTARSLYRCRLSCKHAFPSPDLMKEWAKDVWDEACARGGTHPYLLNKNEEFVYSGMRHLTDIKLRIKQVVEFLYGFDTSRAPESISRNAILAQALLANMTFVYGDLNFGGRPHYPYRHPIIQRVINITWFQNKDDDGIVFHEYFAPIPFEVIALVLTVIECCIDEWSDGAWKESSWSEERYMSIYISHLNTLRDFREHGLHQQGGDLLAQIQYDLLKGARMHAGAPPDPVTGGGRFPLAVLDAALQDDPLDYDPRRIRAITVSGE